MDANTRISKARANPVSPTTTKCMVESENIPVEAQTHHKTGSSGVSGSKSNILSMTIKNKDNILSKNSGTIESSSYNSLISHQSKSFSNAKNEKSMNNIISTKSIVTKKR